MAIHTDTPVAIITGSTKGIGRAIAIALAQKGINVVITSRRLVHARETAAEIASICGHNGGKVIGLQFSLENLPDLDRLINETVEYFGRLDVLVNNAVTQSCLLHTSDASDKEVILTITANLSHTYLLCQKSKPYLKQQAGCILNIASVVANHHLSGLPLYGLIKGAVIHMTKVLASEWAVENIRVNTISPGFVKTRAFESLGMDPELIEKSYRYYADYQPLSGIVNSTSIGEAAAFLTSQEAKSITGTVIEVDGGYSIKGLKLYNPSPEQ